MKKIKIILAVIIITPLLSMKITNIELVTKKIENGKVSVKIPVNFKQMTKQEKALAFSRQDSPIAAYTNEDQSVMITIKQELTKQATPETMDYYKDQYVKANNYFAKCTDSGFFTKDNKKYAFVRVEGLKLSKQRNRIIYTEVSFTDALGYILECRFYCPADDAEKWKPTADKIIRSFKASF